MLSVTCIASSSSRSRSSRNNSSGANQPVHRQSAWMLPSLTVGIFVSTATRPQLLLLLLVFLLLLQGCRNGCCGQQLSAPQGLGSLHQKA